MNPKELEEADEYFFRLFESDEKIPYDFDINYLEARGCLTWTEQEAKEYIREFLEDERKRNLED